VTQNTAVLIFVTLDVQDFEYFA